MKTKCSFAIIEKLVILLAGDDMDNRINILDMEIEACTAKEAMKRSMEYLVSDPVNVVEFLTIDSLMRMDALPELKKQVGEFDLVLAGNKAILEAADISDRKYLKETEKQTFLKMFMRYLHKNHKRVYLLAESEEEGKMLYHELQQSYGGIQIIGLAKVSAQNRADDMLVNAINGGEVDCVISTLSSPLQEEFIVKNRQLLDLRVWIGIGKSVSFIGEMSPGRGPVAQFILRHILKRELEKRKKTDSVSG